MQAKSKIFILILILAGACSTPGQMIIHEDHSPSIREAEAQKNRISEVLSTPSSTACGPERQELQSSQEIISDLQEALQKSDDQRKQNAKVILELRKKLEKINLRVASYFGDKVRWGLNGVGLGFVLVATLVVFLKRVKIL